jgi:hypothetical protein
MIAPPAACIGSQETGKASTRGIIAPATAAGCMPTVMPGSRTFIGPVQSTGSPAWPADTIAPIPYDKITWVDDLLPWR